jgi:hypothetical protein
LWNVIENMAEKYIEMWNDMVNMEENISWIVNKSNNKLPNSEQSYKGKVKTHRYINRQNQSTTGKLWKP